MPELIFMVEYGKLKRMGFTFQKLYASNRMHWIKNNLIICKKHRTFRYCDLPNGRFDPFGTVDPR